jgi:SAM-dependent methyltransferase
MTAVGYSPDRCDLCDSAEFSPLPLGVYDRGMWSDSRISSRPLRKRLCSRCGLIRDGNAFTPDAIARHYTDAYELNAMDDVVEHQFFRHGRAIARSDAMAEWIAGALALTDGGRSIGSLYEVGAGAGSLLARFNAHYPGARLRGCEMNAAVAGAARRRGFDVTDGDERALAGRHDVIVAAFVLEHVPSPVAFLRHLSRHLAKDGRIVVAQPMQDVESHDVYFVDHLHHFATPHVEWLANRAGLVQATMSASPWFAANASVHILHRGQACPAVAYLAPVAVASATARWEAAFESCRLLPPGRYALFGAGEFAGLLQCYGRLDRLDPVMVLDDVPERHPAGAFGLPVRALDAVSDAELADVDAVILALNPAYHDSVARRCADRRLTVINPFAAGCPA